MKILLIGFGNVGKIIYELEKENIVGIIDLKRNFVNEKPDVIIDFSNPNLLDTSISYSKKYKVPLIVGTTGYDNKKMAQIKELSNFVPVLKSENFSLGILLLKMFINKNYKMFCDYEKEIIETHHINKVDSPSGTALMLAELLQTKKIISKREESFIGKHEITLNNSNEEIKLIHNTLDRKVFANGAIMCAKWLVKQNKGYYSFEDYYYGL